MGALVVELLLEQPRVPSRTVPLREESLLRLVQNAVAFCDRPFEAVGVDDRKNRRPHPPAEEGVQPVLRLEKGRSQELTQRISNDGEVANSGLEAATVVVG